ncbi:MAG: low molecular weight protein arginine phosphatase [Clostridia bacterium]|nr:low molecular weight protein arginine phosphatase [Clostridia bacterium]
MKNILFVCTGNTCRSSMAEGLFKHLAGERGKAVETGSAGTAVFGSQGASKNAVLALKEMGIDLSSHRSRSVTREMIDKADLVLTMTRSHKAQLLALKPDAHEKVFTLAEYCSGQTDKDISDPFGGDLNTYIACRNEITDNLKKLLDKLV